MTASNGNGEFKGTVKEAIRRMDLNIAKIEAGLENFDARMEMRFEKFKSDLKEVFVTK